MSIGCFTDKKCQPGYDEVKQAISSRLSIWESLASFIRENYPVQEDFKFLYGKNYGWALRFGVKGQLLTSLFPTRGGFTAQVNLSPESIEKIQGLELTENVHRAIQRANPYPEGRWLFIPVESEEDRQAVQQLLAMRAQEKRLLR